MSASQRMSQKTYVEMGEADMFLIEAYCYGFGLNAKQAADYIEWPWQSINQHLKVMNDRIDRHKDTLDHIMARAQETITKLGLVKPEVVMTKKKEAKLELDKGWDNVPNRLVKPDGTVPDMVFKNPNSAPPAVDLYTPPPASTTTDELLPISCPPPFYMLALDDLIHQLRSGAIAFRSLFVDDERGVLELRYKKELQL